MPLGCLTPQFEKGNVFCSLPPVARSTCCRTLDVANHAQNNNVIYGKTMGQEGSVYVEEEPEKSPFSAGHG